MKGIGKPDEGKLHVRFDEGVLVNGMVRLVRHCRTKGVANG